MTEISEDAKAKLHEECSELLDIIEDDSDDEEEGSESDNESNEDEEDEDDEDEDDEDDEDEDNEDENEEDGLKHLFFGGPALRAFNIMPTYKFNHRPNMTLF